MFRVIVTRRALKDLKNINKEIQYRIAVAGASYGGYMINWIEVYMDEFKYPFKCLVNHDGTFNLYAKLLTTEELWFPEWEFGGSCWENDGYYKKWLALNIMDQGAHLASLYVISRVV